MDKKQTCRSKKPDDLCKTSESDKSVTGLYYGKISNLINKKKIKCIYEPLEDYKESTGSLVESESNLVSGISMEVKIFNKEDASSNGSFFDQEDLTKGCIKPSSGSENSENFGIAIGIQISARENSENLKVVAEFDVVGSSTTSVTELKQYGSRMKLLEETPSKMIFNGIIKLQPREQPLQITNIPLYIIDSKEKIVENPGFSVSYKTSAKPGDSLEVDKPTDVLVKLKVDKPTRKKRDESAEPSARKQTKECCCNKQETKKTTISDILMCRKNKSKTGIDGAQKSASRSGSCAVQDKKTETIGSTDAATQSNVNLQASKSNQTASQVSVSSGRDLQNQSNQTNTQEEPKESESQNRKSVVSIKDPQESTVSAQSVLVEDDRKSKFDARKSSTDTRKSEDIELTRRESKHQQKRKEGWDRLEKKRSKDDAKLTRHNTNSSLRNAATQSSTNKITANKEISVQYSFISPTYGIFADNNLSGSSSTLTNSLVPVKSAPFAQLYPKSIESTSTQWPQSLTSTDNHSQTLTLISDVFDNADKGNDPIKTDIKNAPSPDGSYGFPQQHPQVMYLNFSTQTDLLRKPDMVDNYCQYVHHPVEDEIVSLNLDSKKKVSYNFKENHKTLDLLERAKFKLGEYAGKHYYPVTPKAISNEEVADVCSIPQNESEEDDDFPKYVDKEIDAPQLSVKKQSLFTKFINHLKPVEAPMTIAQYHTICSTSNPFQLKPIPSLQSAKLELELQTLEFEKVNNKLCEEIESLQKIYKDLYTNVSFIFENKDMFPLPSVLQTKGAQKGSIKNIDRDVSATFTELRGCLSTIDKILSDASLQSVYETPPSTASPSREDIAAENDEIHTTYTTVENDIKKTIKELLKESEYIKHQALLNGAPEEPEPPFFFEYIDLLKESNPLVICKSIVDDLSSKTSSTKQQKDEKIDEKPKKYRQDDNAKERAKKSLGSCSRIKTIDNKKNDRITYFCTTFVSKVPKTSFSFGGNSRALHREKRIQKKETITDNTTSGDNVKVHEEDMAELSKTCIDIMEPNLTTKNFISINDKSDLGSLNLKEEVNSQNYEKNLSYSNYIAYLNSTNSSEDSGRDAKNIAEVPKEPCISDLLEEVINNEVNIQVQESVLTNESSVVGSENSSEIVLRGPDGIKPKDEKKNISSQPGMILKSPKSFLLAESFNRANNMPSTSATFYKRTETTDEEEVIREMDLTNESRQTPKLISDESLEVEIVNQTLEPHCQRFRSTIESYPSTSSEELIVRRNPPKHLKRSKEFKTITLKSKTATIMDSDSDEAVIKLMQDTCQENSQAFSESSSVLLRSTRANTNVGLLHSSKSMLGASCSGVSYKKHHSQLRLGNDLKENSNESDYDGDYETDQFTTTSIPIRVYKSKQEINSPEEIERIEENVRQNDMLERRNLHIFFQPGSAISICENYSPVFNRGLVSDYSLSDSSPEIYSSDKN